MSIVIKDWFLNNWGIPTTSRKTWLEATKNDEEWANKQTSESGFLSPESSNTPNFNTDSEETYLEEEN